MIKATHLDIGCGPHGPREGYVGVDVVRWTPSIVCCPAWKITQHFERGVEKIYSRHMLEHLTFEDFGRTLTDWMSALVPGGEIDVVVPDLTYHCRQFLGLEERTRDSQTSPKKHALAGFFGWQTRDYDLHLSGWDFEMLEDYLRRAGFTDIARVDDEPWNLHVTAKKPDKETR